jgi:hypothetical protein
MPDLGEYMSTIQLHVPKLWIPAQSSNWGLATYELHELEETIEAAERLHAIKNGVNISTVLQSVEQTQLPFVDLSRRRVSVRSRQDTIRPFPRATAVTDRMGTDSFTS